MESHAIDDKSLMLMLGIALFITQIVYFIISKFSTNKVVNKLGEIMKDLSPHFDRTKHMESMLNDLKVQHEAVDAEGKPRIYYPPAITVTQKEIITSLLEISKILLETSRIHNEMRIEVGKQHDKFEAFIHTHSDTCKEQFVELTKKFEHVLKK